MVGSRPSKGRGSLNAEKEVVELLFVVITDSFQDELCSRCTRGAVTQ